MTSELLTILGQASLPTRSCLIDSARNLAKIRYVLQVASGKKTKAEKLGQSDFSIDRLLPNL